MAAPPDLACALVGKRAVPIVSAGLLANGDTAVVALPTFGAATNVRGDARPIVIASSNDLRYNYKYRQKYFLL